MKNNRPFGYSLHLDCWDCSPLHLEDPKHCEAFLFELVKRLKVSIQKEPVVVVTPKQFEDKAGLSSWVPLVESGIAMSGIQNHTLSVTNAIFVDVFACSPFSEAMVREVVNEWYSPKAMKGTFLERGVGYYQEE